MSERKPVAYNGNSPYVFVSYSHKDNAVVYPFILALQEICNVWFDEGIHYGNEWEDEIAAKLEGCSIFIYMITPNSLASSNCKDEIAFAREMDKNFINVLVNSETELSKAFRLRYGRYQMCKLDSFGTVEMAVADLARKCKWMAEVAKDGGPVAQEDKPAAPATRTEPRGRIEPPFDMSEIGSIRLADEKPESRKSRKIASARGASAPSPAATDKENSGDAEAQFRPGTMHENGGGGGFNDGEAKRGGASPSMSSIEQTILNVFRHDGVLCGKNDVYVGNGIPAAKARNLAAACNAGLNPGFLVVVDCTVFGSCKNGMGISAQGIYTHNDWAADCKSGFVSWDELVRDGRIRKGSSFEILFVRSRTIGINLSGSDVKQDELLPFLETLRDAVENLYKTAAPAATPDGYFPERDAEPSPAEMAKQCRALALEGDAEAQYLLGTMYENGLGVRFNDEEAKKWYRKAAAQGYADARRALRRMG